MRILHTESSPGFGGQEIRILEEAKGLRTRGHEIILVIQQGGGLVQPARDAGFLVYEISFSKKNAIFIFCKIAFILLKHKIDTLNTHSSLDSWIGGFAAKFLRKKIVRTRHLSTPIKKGLNSYLLYNFLADKVVTTCQEVADTLKKQASLSDKRCISIPTGVKEFTVKAPLPKNNIIAGTLCIIRGWKGISDLLQAALILKDIPDLTWKIIGGGVSEEHFKQECAKYNLQEKVIFTGYLKEPFEELASLDIFLLLSYAHEGVSQASLQAAWLKKPLITTPTGGLKEVCIPNKTGFLVDIRSPTQVADAVLKLYNSKKLRDEMGERAHHLVKEKFTFEHTLNEMERILL